MSKKPENINANITAEQIISLYDLAVEILADGQVSQFEGRQLVRWFSKNPEYATEPVLDVLANCVIDAMEDGVLDENEEDELFTLLNEFCEIVENEVGEVSAVDEDQPLTPADLVVHSHYRMVYKDASGNISERDIIFKKFVTKDDGRQHLHAYCMLRKAHKTFRGDRVMGLFSLDSGEVIV